MDNDEMINCSSIMNRKLSKSIMLLSIDGLALDSFLSRLFFNNPILQPKIIILDDDTVIFLPKIINPRYLRSFSIVLPKISKYLFDISQYILLPLYSFVRLFVYSFDVIHTLGIFSGGGVSRGSRLPLSYFEK